MHLAYKTDNIIGNSASRKLIHFYFNDKKSFFFLFALPFFLYSFAFISIGITWLIILKLSWKKTRVQFFLRGSNIKVRFTTFASFPNSKYILTHSLHLRECNIEWKRLWYIPGRRSFIPLAISSSFVDTPLTSRIQSLFTLLV